MKLRILLNNHAATDGYSVRRENLSVTSATKSVASFGSSFVYDSSSSTRKASSSLSFASLESFQHHTVACPYIPPPAAVYAASGTRPQNSSARDAISEA
ncbi:MAG: hypothetical protein VKL59_10940 [Nostocaceae cyanobacterium]|nr:hypothetical protein [Nostocaceae cyanobacterium]